MERVIFRREYNPYTKEWGFLAAFPDDECNMGMIACTPFGFNRDGRPYFEPYTEVSLSYYYGKKIVHRRDQTIGRLRKAIEDYYKTTFRVCEKI